MMSPPAETIEGAIEDLLKRTKVWLVADQLKELRSAVGQDSATSLQISYPLNKDFEQGYCLGLQVARRLIEQNPFLDDETRAKISL